MLEQPVCQECRKGGEFRKSAEGSCRNEPGYPAGGSSRRYGMPSGKPRARSWKCCRADLVRYRRGSYHTRPGASPVRTAVAVPSPRTRGTAVFVLFPAACAAASSAIFRCARSIEYPPRSWLQ